MKLFTLISCAVLVLLICLLQLTAANQDGGNLENQCKPYVEKALKDQLSHQTEPASDEDSHPDGDTQYSSEENVADTQQESAEDATQSSEVSTESQPTEDEVASSSEAQADEQNDSKPEEDKSNESQTGESGASNETDQNFQESPDQENQSVENAQSAENETPANEDEKSSEEKVTVEEAESKESGEVENAEVSSAEAGDQQEEPQSDSEAAASEEKNDAEVDTTDTSEDTSDNAEPAAEEEVIQEVESESPPENEELTDSDSKESKEGSDTEKSDESVEAKELDEAAESGSNSGEEALIDGSQSTSNEAQSSEVAGEDKEVEKEADVESDSKEDTEKSSESPEVKEQTDESSEADNSEGDKSDEVKSNEEPVDEKSSEKSSEDVNAEESQPEDSEKSAETQEEQQTEDQSTESTEGDSKGDDSEESAAEKDEDELTKEFSVPDVLRPRDQITEILGLSEASDDVELATARAADVTLRDLKHIYDSAVKPLENLYKYRDLSNRHFGDPEIFSKPLILFMGPWSGGKSSIINYLLNNEYNETTLRTGAEPSPAYFNILMHGDEAEIIDGTTIVTDWTFSGLQKFGQGLEDRLRGLKLPNKLLEKVNIVEIPGILEVRKQVSRSFPFNDACQWFIDRADVIFLVYDPSKLDVGPETEAILDQLKGREYQTRVILNKADTVKAEELLRVQGALIWNISPLMASSQPPVIYTTSLWSQPYSDASPVRLLQAQERAFLRDLRHAVDKRVENKIASARRFAVRVRNHAKMVDCYLTTYYNHKTLFGNRKVIADEIIEHPQDYHIYEGISTLKNISRYDLPDPDTYKDFFRLNPLWEFQALSATCTYFKGCPINKLDVAIAYDFPELLGKYRKQLEKELDKIKSS